MKLLRLATIGVCVWGMTSSAFAHCEIPCGIYGDQARFDAIEEHSQTIEKSMQQINELSANPGENANQLIRWVRNKEDHANLVQEIVSQYFLTQRIKPTQEDYEKKVTTLHQMLIAAMKCKQTTDTENVQKLRELTADFHDLYFGEAEHAHLHEHHGIETN